MHHMRQTNFTMSEAEDDLMNQFSFIVTPQFEDSAVELEGDLNRKYSINRSLGRCLKARGELEQLFYDTSCTNETILRVYRDISYNA